MIESYEQMIRYEIPVDYDYIIPHYFVKDADLLSAIADSGEDKWIWFIRSRNVGAQYVHQLSEKDIDAVLITKDSRNAPKFTAERMAVDSIETQSLFAQKVLFATSTLDNGINIKDAQVKHIVIDEFNHTEFIQKLGRIRVEKPTKIHLYIKSRFVADVVNHFWQPRSIIDILQFMADFTYMKNAYTKHKQLRESRYFQDNKFTEPYCKHLEQSYGSQIREVSGNNYELFCNDIKEFSKLLYSYEYYKLMAWLEELFESGQIDENLTSFTEEYYWLNKQLSWIGKEYDENQWVNADEHALLRDLLITKLELFSSGRYMTADEQANFKETFLKYAASCHIPDPAAKSKASVETINSAFKRWNIPYQVISDRQRIDGIRARYWRIVPLSETTILPMIGFSQTKK